MLTNKKLKSIDSQIFVLKMNNYHILTKIDKEENSQKYCQDSLTSYFSFISL